MCFYAWHTDMTTVCSLSGGTPMLEVGFRLDGGPPLRFFAKHEASNGLTGSVKDRMAAYIMRRARESGELCPGDTIVEASSGNTGISFAAIGAASGHPVRIYMPDWMSKERFCLIRSFGAEVVPVSREDGGFRGAIEMAEGHAGRPGFYLPRQFENPLNAEAHEMTTGGEIVAQLALAGLSADAFVAGVGTGGTVMGVGQRLRRDDPSVRVHPLEPANSPTMQDGRSGCHRIEGISDEFTPAIVDLGFLDPVIDVWDGDAILMAQALAKAGLGVGISSGANAVGAVRLAQELGPDSAVVTVFPDCGKKYLSTDLCRDEPDREGYVTPRMSLSGFRVL